MNETHKKVDITVAIPEKLMEELQARFDSSKRAYPNLTIDSFVTWALRYYLQHAYLPPNDDKFYRG